ncbi:hypothetical protein ACRAWD_20530 [Caulobacter segnis]
MKKTDGAEGESREVRLLQRDGAAADRQGISGRGGPSVPDAGSHQILAGPELVSSDAPAAHHAALGAVRERILDAAEFLFSKWGYTGVSIQRRHRSGGDASRQRELLLRQQAEPLHRGAPSPRRGAVLASPRGDRSGG